MGGNRLATRTMSYLINPFEVRCKILARRLRVRFVHLAPGITTRHSDTIDVEFLVDGQKVTVAVPCATLAELRERERRNFTDQQLAEIAAAYLRTTLERGFDPALVELRMTDQELRQVAGQWGYL